VSPLSYRSSSPPLLVTLRVLKDFISTDRHFLIFQDANHLSFWWLALRNVMTLLIGNSGVAVRCVCVCVFCSTRGKKWRVLRLTCWTTVEIFLLQNRRNCIYFFAHVFLVFLTGSYKLTVVTKALPKRSAIWSVSYSTYLRNISEIGRGNLSTWCDSSFWNLWRVLHSLTAHIGHWQLPGTATDISSCFATQQITSYAPSTQPFVDVTVSSLEYMATCFDTHLDHLQVSVEHRVNYSCMHNVIYVKYTWFMRSGSFLKFWGSVKWSESRWSSWRQKYHVH
jgi:hypothetical protein